MREGFLFSERSTLEKIHDGLVVAWMHQGPLGESALPLGLLLRQDVVLERALALDLAGAGQLEPLFCTGLGLHLGHGLFVFWGAYRAPRLVSFRCYQGDACIAFAITSFSSVSGT